MSFAYCRDNIKQHLRTVGVNGDNCCLFEMQNLRCLCCRPSLGLSGNVNWLTSWKAIRLKAEYFFFNCRNFVSNDGL
jgi:hypothetical protein